MTFYELTTAITLQSNVELVIYDSRGDELERRYFRDQDDFSTGYTDTEDLEECEVTYIYCTKSCDGTPWLVVEMAHVNE